MKFDKEKIFTVLNANEVRSEAADISLTISEA